MAEVAKLAGTTPRQVQRAITNGTLALGRQVGRAQLVDDVAALIWRRSVARGRRWTPQVRLAAFGLLESKTTELLTSSERSRLRTKLRSMASGGFAHSAGGVGGAWARYRQVDDQLHSAAPLDLWDEGMVGDHPMRLATTEHLTSFEQVNLVLPDADGGLGVIEREPDDRLARRLLDGYLLGNSRTSAAAGAEIESKLRNV